MAEVDWERYFGFGDLVANKVYIQAIDSNQTLAPQGHITKIQPSTSSGLTVGTITQPWTRMQGVIVLMTNSSAVIAMSSSVAGGNIAHGINLQPNVPYTWMCDGTNWFAISSSTS